MSSQGVVISYRDSELLFRNGWARKRRRLAVKYSIFSLCLPLASFPLYLVLEATEPHAGVRVARHFLETEAGVSAMAGAALVGIFLALLALPLTTDQRVGRLPHRLAGAALLMNGCILFWMLSVMILGMPWAVVV